MLQLGQQAERVASMPSTNPEPATVPAPAPDDVVKGGPPSSLTLAAPEPENSVLQSMTSVNSNTSSASLEEANAMLNDLTCENQKLKGKLLIT